MIKSHESQFTSGSQTLRLLIEWQEDRYQHSILDQAEKVWFRSQECDGLETPVFTELHVQDELLFLSGSSGNCYWSMSVSPCEKAGLKGILFDLAARTNTQVESIGSCYLAPFATNDRNGEFPDIDSPNATVKRDIDQTFVLPQVPDSAAPQTVPYSYELFASKG